MPFFNVSTQILVFSYKGVIKTQMEDSCHNRRHPQLGTLNKLVFSQHITLLLSFTEKETNENNLVY